MKMKGYDTHKRPRPKIAGKRNPALGPSGQDMESKYMKPLSVRQAARKAAAKGGHYGGNA